MGRDAYKNPYPLSLYYLKVFVHSLDPPPSFESKYLSTSLLILSEMRYFAIVVLSLLAGIFAAPVAEAQP